MNKRYSSILYNVLQLLVIGLPLILYKWIEISELGYATVSILYVILMTRVILTLHMTLMETSKMRAYIEESKISKRLEQEYKNVVEGKSVEYREQIKVRDGSKGIGIKRIQGFFWKGYRVVIEDPSTLEVVETDGKTIEKIEGKIKINGGGYCRETGEARGVLKIAGELKVNEEGAFSVIGLTKKGHLKLTYNPTDEEIDEMEYAVTYGPHLILDGRKVKLKEISGVSPRTAIGQREDGSIIFMVVDGRIMSSYGITLQGVQRYMINEGCINASILDGGASSQLARLNNRINKQGGKRVVNNVFRVK